MGRRTQIEEKGNGVKEGGKGGEGGGGGSGGRDGDGGGGMERLSECAGRLIYSIVRCRDGGGGGGGSGGDGGGSANSEIPAEMGNGCFVPRSPSALPLESPSVVEAESALGGDRHDHTSLVCCHRHGRAEPRPRMWPQRM
ncbi:hypothetical protein HZH68_008331 [Vespula germanica]|uniref:Uncharacterized protein n=1 Tax=Vespula germanica TaxID=30212 RepID=A0A834N9D7_VESGE|nr:hypothetical protein HZH68_008331 [Vespula germanica]